MSLLVYKFADYEHTAEREEYRALCGALKRHYQGSGEMCLFIANYNIGGRELDALLIKQDAVIVVEFKDYGGRVTAVENGDWHLADGTPIKGGSRKNVYSQALVNRNSVYNELVKVRHLLRQAQVAALIVFHKPVTVDNRLGGKTQSWLHICDETTFVAKVSDITSQMVDISRTEMLSMVDGLSLDPAYLDHDYSDASLTGKSYTPAPQHHAAEDEGTSAQEAEPRQVAGVTRLRVSRCDNQYIYAIRPADGSPVRVSLSGSLDDYKCDFSYLCPMLGEGDIINVVSPREVDGAVQGDLIIYEPDNLVNVTNVSRCFAEYAESSIVRLIRILEPQTDNENMMLGNLAGQLLSDTLRADAASLRQSPEQLGARFAQSVRDFYNGNALRMLSLNVGEAFKKQARQQMKNIENAIIDDLPKSQGEGRTDGMVEPSFFCQMLGLQARMDYLQYDFRFLIEQKSGKGEFSFDGLHIPHPKREHYVQMLLYMLIVRYNYAALYAANHKELRAYLLYSKYDNALLPLNFSPELVCQAIRIRNGIVWRQRQYARPGGFNLLMELDPDKLNELHIKGRFWEEKLRPKLLSILIPIKNASPLERAYFFRLLQFIACEGLLAKVGKRGGASYGFSAAWRLPLDAKIEGGTIYCNLKLVTPIVPKEGETAISDVELAFASPEAWVAANFRKGDEVVVYPYRPGTEPLLTATIVFRAVIKQLSRASIVVRLNAPQHDARPLMRHPDWLWAVEHDTRDNSSAYRGVHALLTAPKERRDLLLLQRRPRIDTSIELKGDYGDFNDMALRAKQARDIFLIIGPPGTGKTSYGLVNTLKEELLEDGTSVLLAAYTNRAVDCICEQLDHEDIPYIRIGSEERCAPACRPHLLSTLAANEPKLAGLQQKMRETRVVVGTTSSIINQQYSLFQMKRFSLCIVDEASQILEPQMVALLSAMHGAEPAIGRLLMIGDHKQLPAVVTQDKTASAVTDPLLIAIHFTDCRRSLFERLIDAYHDDPQVTYTLTRQGRMHSDIALFPSEWFYGGILSAATGDQSLPLPPAEPTGDSLTDLLMTRRCVFLAVEPTGETSSNNKVNKAEAQVIATALADIYRAEGPDHFNADTSVGVIVPYRNQIAAVGAAIENLARQSPALSPTDTERLLAVTIDTVERFQASQRHTIIFGFTAREPRQLAFLTDNTFVDETGRTIDRKLNVALTRAQSRLVIVGNPSLLCAVSLYKNLIDSIKSTGGFLDAQGYACSPGTHAST